MRRLLAATSAALVAGCATGQQAPASDKDAAMLIVRGCFAEQARALDDGVSNAYSIASGVTYACRDELATAEAVLSAGQTYAWRQGFAVEFKNQARQQAATMVMTNRARRRTD